MLKMPCDVQGDWVKINRTFSIPVSIAMRLKSERNQSSTVSKAVKKYLDEKDEYDPTDLPTRRLMLILRQKDDCPQSIRVLIDDHFGINSGKR
jgi:hypothetical protein